MRESPGVHQSKRVNAVVLIWLGYFLLRWYSEMLWCYREELPSAYTEASIYLLPMKDEEERFWKIHLAETAVLYLQWNGDEAYRKLKHLTNNIVCNHWNSTTWTNEISFASVNIRAESTYSNDLENWSCRCENWSSYLYFCCNKYVLLLNIAYCWNVKKKNAWNQLKSKMHGFQSMSSSFKALP